MWEKLSNEGTTVLLLLTAMTAKFLSQYNLPSKKVKALGFKKKLAVAEALIRIRLAGPSRRRTLNRFPKHREALAQG